MMNNVITNMGNMNGIASKKSKGIQTEVLLIPLNNWNEFVGMFQQMMYKIDNLELQIEDLKLPKPNKISATETMTLLGKSRTSLYNYDQDGSLKKQYDEDGRLYYWRKDVMKKRDEIFGTDTTAQWKNFE